MLMTPMQFAADDVIPTHGLPAHVAASLHPTLVRIFRLFFV